MDDNEHGADADEQAGDGEVAGASRREILTATGAGTLGLLGSSRSVAADDTDGATNAKSRSTIYTKDAQRAARENVSEFDWARRERDEAVATADEYLSELGYEGLWNLVTSQEIPRSSRPAFRYYGWSRITDGRRPTWKMTDGEYVLPTNDFAAYRESGRDDRGAFDPDLADDRHLVNKRYPDKPDDWGVDDGWGWLDEDGDIGPAGTTWTIAAYYNFWIWWDDLRELLTACRNAYLFTGNRRYSRAATVVLDRIADVYPELDVYPFTKNYPDSDFWISHGGRSTGKAVGSHREPELARYLMRAFDGVFRGQDGDDELLKFLGEKADEYPGLDGDAKRSISGVRKHIEDGVVRQMLPAAKSSDLAPHRGAPVTVAVSARVLDETDGYTADAIDYVFRPRTEPYGYVGEDGNWHVDGGAVLSRLVGVADRDGYGNEGAPNYNVVFQKNLRKVADVLQGYSAYEGADLYRHPKFQQMLYSHFPLIMLDNYTPAIGDTRGAGSPDIRADREGVLKGFDVYGDPVLAQAAYLLNGNSTAGMRRDIFSEDPEGLAEDVREVVEADGPLDLPSQNFPGFGFAALRDGENYTRDDYGVRVSFDGATPTEATAGYEVYEGSDTLQFNAESPDEHITFEFEVPEDNEYQIELSTYRADTYGDARIDIDGQQFTTFDFTVPDSEQGTYDLEKLGTKQLSAGTHTVTFTSREYDDGSDDDFTFGIRDLMLLTPQNLETRRNAEQKGNAKRAFWLYYGRNHSEVATSHAHRGSLNVGVYAYDLDLSPDLGYPENTGPWPKRWNWTSNTISHNTVVVNEHGQEPQRVATPLHYDEAERVSLIDVDSADAYPETEAYRRTTTMVRVDDEHSYSVDLFRVAGGDDHRFSFHGAEGPVSTTALDLVAQDGTYAGEDVPKPEHGEDTEYNKRVGNGFNYLYDVRLDQTPPSTFSVDWDVVNTWDVRDDDADGVHLRLTMLGDMDEVAIAKGDPPQDHGNPDTMEYVIARRTGEAIDSTFTSVIEPYEDDRAIESVTRVEVTSEDGDAGDARAVKVELANGRTDYVASGTDSETMYEVGGVFKFKGFLAVYSEVDGDPEHAYLHDGQLLISKSHRGPPLVQQPHGRLTGTVESFTRGMSVETEVTIELDNRPEDVKSTIGEFVYIETDNERNGAYPIEAVRQGHDNRIIVEIGDDYGGSRTFVRGFADPDRLGRGGYVHNVKEGATSVIPTNTSWSATR